MRTRSRSALTLLVSLFFIVGLPACGDDGGTTDPGATFDLTFTGDEPRSHPTPYRFILVRNGTADRRAENPTPDEP